MLLPGQLKPVSTAPRPPLQDEQPGHLELIRKGVQLRKVQPMKQAPPPKPPEVSDPTQLTIGDILEKLAAVREAVASDSSGGGSDSSDSQSDW
jgi:hypothetical protein